MLRAPPKSRAGVLPAFVLGVALCGPAFGQVLFDHNFEDGDLSGWTMVVDKASITQSKVHSGSRALHIPYEIPVGSRDNNRFAQVDLGSKNAQDFYVNGCFYLASTPAPVNQRKLFYIWGDPHTDPKWDVVVSAWGGESGGAMSLSVGSNAYSYSDLRVAKKGGQVKYDTWHCIRLDVKLNSPGSRNGSVSLRLDGAQVIAASNISIRADNKPLGMVRVGAQTNDSDDATRNYEDRYWDDIEIGALGGGNVLGDNAPPKPPSDVSASSN